MEQETRRQRILSTTTDLVSMFLYYDRKDDEELPRGEIEAAIEADEITAEEIAEAFTTRLYEKL